MEKHQLLQIHHVSPSAGDLPVISTPAGAAAGTQELSFQRGKFPRSLPASHQGLSAFQSVILCFPPTAHPQHLSLCSKLIRLSPKIKSSPAVCCAVKMRGCEPHHAPLSLKRQQKSRRRRYGFCEHHCGSCLTPETPSPEQGEGRKTTPALSPPISFPPCCPSMPCQCQPAPAQDCPSTGLPAGQSTACDAEQHLLLVSLYIPT